MAKDDEKMSPEELAELLAEGEQDGDDDEIEIEGGDEAEDAGGAGDDDTIEIEGEGDPAGEDGDQDDEIPDGQHPGLTPVQQQPAAAPTIDLRALLGVPEDAPAKIAEIDSKVEALTEEWDQGQIGEQTFKTRLRELTAERAKIEAAMDAVEKFAAAEQERRAAEDDARWKASVDSFRAANPTLWKDEHRGRFNEHVKAVTADPRYSGMTFDQQLTLAARFYTGEREALGLSAPEVRRPTGAKSQTPRRPPLPQTLAHVPAAEPMGMDGTDLGRKFARIDAMDPDRAEAAIAALSEAERNAYLQGVG